ncbi:ketopantoate reductase family protein [Pseudoroseicyclus tamaricis]|uniref:2-dehydropantoate 2-reductase n=1 Tax=Pseudoroseicyclus tamaricis TaxID=2705421 RepID=A0A6B2JTT1_9RHOB|nr:ketopantoate reductase family protein [Pseudoroseicyclus tamaricis]NDV01460.1 ketopantoate reductase family protein [Pseudoroseicyclus tamaricis]
MRIIIVGIGAVGGTLAGSLALAGQDVAAVARGPMLEALRGKGLTLRTTAGTRQAQMPVFASPAEAGIRPDDTILLCTKTQHTEGALDQLRAAGVEEQPIFCFQNGVENERLALRRFPNIHAVTVMLPADYVTAGEVVAFGAPKLGIFDIGRYPGGTDAADEALIAALQTADFRAWAGESVMASKYGKLLLNLGNIADAALPAGELRDRLQERLVEEGRAVLKSAGIEAADVGKADPRRDEFMKIGEVEGVDRTGSSSTQSLARAAGSIESDFLNGEIALLGRLHGHPAPLNAWAAALGARMVRDGMAPQSVPEDEAEAALAR